MCASSAASSERWGWGAAAAQDPRSSPRPSALVIRSSWLFLSALDHRAALVVVVPSSVPALQCSALIMPRLLLLLLVAGTCDAQCPAGSFLPAGGLWPAPWSRDAVPAGVSATLNGPGTGWSDLITISDCGNDGTNTCGAGSMTKLEAAGWNNRVWDDRPCCWNCPCTGARWNTAVSDHVYCGFSSWDDAGSTDPNADWTTLSYGVGNHGSVRVNQGGPGAATWSDADIEPQVTYEEGSFLEVHLTQTGADIWVNGVMRHSIHRAPTASQYRFNCGGDEQNSGYTDLAYLTSPNGDSCADCPDGTTSAAGSTLSECKIICAAPDSIPVGFETPTENNLDLSAGDFDVIVACAAGYEPTATATACTTSGPYTLGGCTSSIICTTPDPIPAGYETPTENNLDLSAGDLDVIATCATGFEAAPAVTTCTTSGPYTLSGCAAVVCTTPTGDDVAGYDVSNEQLTLGTSTFSVAVECAAGYESTGDGPAAIACTVSGAYTLSGCAAIVCSQPDDVTGYSVVEVELNVATGFSVSAACADGYESTGDGLAATACTASGVYTLSGCSPIVCTTPDPIPAEYNPPTEGHLDLSTGSFDVTATCATGFSGTGVATCTTSGPYTLSGCSGECIQQVGNYYQCSSSSSCRFTLVEYGENELEASVQVSATGSSGFASATASASVSGSSMAGYETSSTFELEGGTCKYNVLHVTNDYSASGCDTGKTIRHPEPVPHSNLLCEVDYTGTSTELGSSEELPPCSDSQIDQFITQCGITPPSNDAPPPVGATPAPTPSSATISTLSSALLLCTYGCALLQLM